MDWATHVDQNVTVAPWSRSTAAGAGAQTDLPAQIGTTIGMGVEGEAWTAVSALSHVTLGSRAVAMGLVMEVGAVQHLAMTQRDMRRRR